MKEAVKLHMVCISSNNERQPVPKTFTLLSVPHSYITVHCLSCYLYKFNYALRLTGNRSEKSATLGHATYSPVRQTYAPSTKHTGANEKSHYLGLIGHFVG
jgi:hypothetical protein